MLIADMKAMEEIVEKNPELHWEGWNVVRITQGDNAEYQKNGFYNRATGKWHIREVYKLDGIGWDIPNAVIFNEK
jgi:hypothetical protein